MSLLISGRISAFVLLLVIFAAMYLSMNSASKSSEPPYIRRVAGLDAIEESIERAAEMNRPIMSGYGIMPFSPGTLAALSIVGYVSRNTAKTGAEVLVPAGGDLGTSIVYPQAIETVRSAYDEEGKLEDYKPENVIFLSENQFAWATAQIGMIHERNIGAMILTGGYGPEIVALSEEAKSVGSIVIVSGNLYSLCATACIADYVLIGEEQIAAGAYLSKDPIQIGSIRGQDWGRLIAVALILVGVLAKAVGYDFLTPLLEM